MISKINVPSLEPLMFKKIIAGNGVSKFLLRGSLEYQNERLKRIIERGDQKSINNEFKGIVDSLFGLVSGYTTCDTKTSIEDWKKQMTKAVNQIAMGLREFVRKLLNDHGQITVIQKNKEQLRGFAGLNDRNELITKPVN